MAKDTKKSFFEKSVNTIAGKYTETNRPNADFTEVIYNYNYSRPYSLNGRNLYNLALSSDVIQIITNTSNCEVFRNGFEIKPAFIKKCIRCDKEYQNEVKVDKCECGGILRNPMESERKTLARYVEKNEPVNLNGQTLLDLYKSLNSDLKRVDDSFRLQDFEYSYNENEEIVLRTLKETIRLHPLNVIILADKLLRMGRDPKGNKLYVCPRHREVLLTEGETKQDKCPTCGGTIYPAFYSIGGSANYNTKGDLKYYADHEIVHNSEYCPSLAYGTPNVFFCYDKILMLIAMDRFLRDFYTKRRTPSGILAVNTANADSFQTALETATEYAARDPNNIPAVCIENQEGAGDMIKWIDILKTPQEMMLIETRNEAALKVGALYGISAIWMSDSSDGSGNAPEMKVVITNRAIQTTQEIFNEKDLPKFVAALGVTDWKIVLKPNESRNELADAQLFGQKILNAMNMRQMGFKVSLKEDGKDFDYEDAEPSTPLLIDPTNPQGTINPQQNQMPGAPKNQKIPVQNQRMDGESVHDHTSQNQKVDGETLDIKRTFENHDGRPGKVGGSLPEGESKKKPEGGNEYIRDILDIPKKDFIDKYRTNDYLLDKLKEDLKTEYKDKTPEAEELLSLAWDKSRKAYNKLKNIGKSQDNFSEFIGRERDEIVKECGGEIKKEVDDAFIEKLKDSLFSKAFEGLSKAKSNQIKDIFLNGLLDEKSNTDMIKKIQELVGEAKSKGEVENIVRTEMQSIRNTSREYYYNQFAKKDAVYKWVSIPDKRRTNTCSRISERTKKGVSIEKLKDIIREESKKDFPEFEPRDWSAHYSCRSTFVKI
jgi:hypothetical protein